MNSYDTLLKLISLETDVYYNGVMCGDWVIHESQNGQTVFHWVTYSEAELCVKGNAEFQKISLKQGDLVIFPRELPHQIRSTLSRNSIEASYNLPYPKEIQKELTGLLCGSVKFSHAGSQSFLDALPSVMIVREGGQWVSSLLTMIYKESELGEASSKSIINRLAELVFCHSIRWYLQQNPKKVGMLSLYVDSVFGPMLTSIYLNPAKNWSLESMSKFCGLSRTVFATRFKSASGWTPNQYLTWVRMQIAWVNLEKGESTSRTAEKVGYFSDAAFSKVFQKEFGKSPSKVRNGII